jgi:hypothetical protein
MINEQVRLKPVVHDNKSKLWCGPAVLSSISGQPTSIIHRMIRDYTGRPSVKGTSHSAVVTVAGKLGYHMVTHHVPVKGRPTLAAWLRQNRTLVASNTIVIGLTNHWVAVSGRSFVDSHTKKPVSYGKAPHRRCRVERYMIVSRNAFEPQLPVIVKKTDPHRKLREEAKALAAKYGIRLEKYENAAPGAPEYWVYPPEALDSDEADRYAGDHLGCDWGEILHRVKGYVEDLTTPKQEVQVAA